MKLRILLIRSGTISNKRRNQFTHNSKKSSKMLISILNCSKVRTTKINKNYGFNCQKVYKLNIPYFKL